MTLPELPKQFYHHTSQRFLQLRSTFIYQLYYYKRASIAFINRYWFRLTIIGFFIGVLCLKEVSIELKWQESNNDFFTQKTVLPTLDQAAIWTAKKEETMPKEVSLKRKKQLKYVTRFAKVARSEMKKYGIPASITLAQGLLETNAGDSPLATKMNNHFGIKCFSKQCKKGHCANFSDDSHKDFFRRYATAWESFRAHSQLLQSKRYRLLYDLPADDYVAWAKGLKRAGYATDRHYPEKLIRLIEELNLQQYDQ